MRLLTLFCRQPLNEQRVHVSGGFTFVLNLRGEELSGAVAPDAEGGLLAPFVAQLRGSNLVPIPTGEVTDAWVAAAKKNGSYALHAGARRIELFYNGAEAARAEKRLLLRVDERCHVRTEACGNVLLAHFKPFWRVRWRGTQPWALVIHACYPRKAYLYQKMPLAAE